MAEDYTPLYVGIACLFVGLVVGAAIGWLAKSCSSSSEPVPKTIMTNLEEWELVRNEEGFLEDVKVHRTVKS